MLLAELALVFRLCVGGLLVAVGISKLRDLGSFRRAVDSYDLLPRAAVGLAASTIALLELIAGLALVIGVQPFGTVVALALVTTFSFAIALNLARHRTIPCGCGIGADEIISGRQLARNIVLVGMLGALLVLPMHPWSVEAALGAAAVDRATWVDGIVAVLMALVLLLGWSVGVKARALMVETAAWRHAVLSDHGNGGEVTQG